MSHKSVWDIKLWDTMNFVINLKSGHLYCNITLWIRYGKYPSLKDFVQIITTDNLADSVETMIGQSGASGRIDIEYDGDIAIMHMRCGENRMNFSFIDKFLKALDEIER